MGFRPAYKAAAQELGEALASRGIGLVYGGSLLGLMGVIADAALAAGGEVTGVIPTGQAAKEIAHPGLTQLHTVSSMHERKALMAKLSDAFVALPGGYGTLEEFCEVLTWAMLGLHEKPCGLLNIYGYYDPLISMFDRAVAEGFLRPEYRSLVLEEKTPLSLLEALASHQPPKMYRWMEPEET